MAMSLNGKVCNELVLNTDTLEFLMAHFMGIGLDALDPSNTLWKLHYEEAGGAADPGFRTWMDLIMDDESSIDMTTLITKTGEEQAMTWCKNIYDDNGIADLEGQDGNVCCQYYNIADPDVEDMMYVALTTATSLTDVEGPITMTSEDDDGVEQTYDVSVGAVIFDASVPLVFEEEEEEEELGASFNSLKWGALALSTLMLAQ